MIPWSLAIAYVSAVIFLSASAQQLCNGHAEFCNRSYGNITFIGAHDSAFVSSTAIVSANQHYDVTKQLDDGIRLLQSQGHNSSTGSVQGGIELCHTNCEIFDGGTLLSYLQKVKTWLDQNPDEVLTILFTNQDGIDITVWGQDFQTAGIDSLAYIPPFSTTPSDTLNWPTLGSMISSGKRVVIFLDAGADTSKVNFILPEFTYMWETPFDQTSTSFPCTVDRPPSIVGQFPTGRLAVVNHFLDSNLGDNILIPDVNALNTTNAVSGTGSLGQQIIDCAALYGRYPNFLLVDYYDQPNDDVFIVANLANGVSATASATVSGSAQATSTSTSKAISAAAARKVLPLFVIMQVVLSSAIIGGAFWLAWDGDMAKYKPLQDQSATLIPAKFGSHRKYDSIASVGSDHPFMMELEQGALSEGHRPTESVTNLPSQAAMMGRGYDSRRTSMESIYSHDDIASLRRMLDHPTAGSRGIFVSQRDTLLME